MIGQGAQIMREFGDGRRDAGARSESRMAVMGSPLSRLCRGGWLVTRFWGRVVPARAGSAEWVGELTGERVG